jgi:hypothetical protein
MGSIAVPFLDTPSESDIWFDLRWEQSAFLAGSCGEEAEEANLAKLTDCRISCSAWEAGDTSEDG